MIDISGKNRFYYADTSQSGGTPRQLIWIQLSSLDNSPQKFWKTFLDALSSWNVSYTQYERQAGFPESPERLRQCLNALAAGAREVPLIIEINNRNRIYNQQVQQFFHELIRFQCPDLFVLLLSIEQDDEMDMEEAIEKHKFRYFSEAEERIYYADHGAALDDGQFALIREFTEGWSAAVIIFTQQHLLVDDIPSIFEDFDSYIVHWIRETHEQRYSEESKRLFYLLTLLDDFPMDLFDELPGWDKEAAKGLFESSAFLRLNANTNRFYLCGHLRRHLLRSQHLLEKKERNQFLIYVGDWYRKQGNQIDAIGCYRKADAYKKILHVLLQWRFPLSRETAACYLETINALPVSFLEKHPLLYVLRAYSLNALYRYPEANTLLESFCIKYDQGEETPEELRPVLGEAYCVWSYNAIVAQNLQQAVDRSVKAAALLPNGSSMGTNFSRQADIPTMVFTSPETGSVEQYLDFSRKMDASIAKVISGLREGMSHLFEAELCFYTRNFKEVEGAAHKAIYEALEWERYDIACSAYFLLMRYSLAKNNYERLMESLEQLRAVAKRAKYESFFSMPDLAEAWLALKLGKRHLVADWIIDNKKHDALVRPWNIGRDLVARCAYLLENQSWLEAISLADIAIDVMEKRGIRVLKLQLQLMKAIACNNADKQSEAAALFGEIYHWIHANNLVMLAIEYGNHIPALVSTYRSTGDTAIPDDWLSMIQKKARTYHSYIYSIRKKHQQKESVKTSVLESLSSTEQKVLLMVSNGMTFKEIAEAQNRTENAVKSMMHKVYSKIGAKGKADAVRIATECGIKEFVKW